jgi:hypothetical protein
MRERTHSILHSPQNYCYTCLPPCVGRVSMIIFTYWITVISLGFSFMFLLVSSILKGLEPHRIYSRNHDAANDVIPN